MCQDEHKTAIKERVGESSLYSVMAFKVPDNLCSLKMQANNNIKVNPQLVVLRWAVQPQSFINLLI